MSYQKWVYALSIIDDYFFQNNVKKKSCEEISKISQDLLISFQEAKYNFNPTNNLWQEPPQKFPFTNLMNILLELLQVLHSFLFSAELLSCTYYKTIFLIPKVKNLKKIRCNLGKTVIMNDPYWLTACMQFLHNKDFYLEKMSCYYLEPMSLEL